jgi:hypothetical protein
VAAVAEPPDETTAAAMPPPAKAAATMAPAIAILARCFPGGLPGEPGRVGSAGFGGIQVGGAPAALAAVNVAVTPDGST